MFKDIATYMVISAVSAACLGLLTLAMIRDTIANTDAGPSD